MLTFLTLKLKPCTFIDARKTHIQESSMFCGTGFGSSQPMRQTQKVENMEVGQIKPIWKCLSAFIMTSVNTFLLSLGAHLQTLQTCSCLHCTDTVGTFTVQNTHSDDFKKYEVNILHLHFLICACVSADVTIVLI